MEEPLQGAGFGPHTVGAGLPETLEEAERRAASIEQAVHQETGHRVRNLSVEVGPQGVQLKGRCATYHCKQLAQHAAMNMADGDRLTNLIEVH